MNVSVVLDLPRGQHTIPMSVSGNGSLGDFYHSLFEMLFYYERDIYSTIFRREDVEQTVGDHDIRYARFMGFYRQQPQVVMELVDADTFKKTTGKDSDDMTLIEMVEQMPLSLLVHMRSAVPCVEYYNPDTGVAAAVSLDDAFQMEGHAKSYIAGNPEIHVFRPAPAYPLRENIFMHDPAINIVMQRAVRAAHTRFAEYMNAA